MYYITLKGAERDHDFKVEKKEGAYELTDLETNKALTLPVGTFDLDYGSLLRFKMGNEEKLVQFVDVKEELHYNFYYKGNTIEAQVYDANQYKYKKYMAPPKKIDYAKSVLSPMPGSIVSISVEAGQVVADGQELLVIEAMKM